MHSFPLIPTRLPLLAMDPDFAFAAGVQMAALLAALFTYLYCRRLGLGPVAAAAGGWTFACSGFFASRVLAGHLPLLEAYPALPLFLWLAEVNLQSPEDRSRAWKLLAAGAASCAVALAGHPQIPAYAFIAAFLYLLSRARTRRGAAVAAAMALGIGAASFALYPMLLLIRRSTRILALAPSLNDVAFPYRRLLAFALPWIDGWPVVVNRMPPLKFEGYPNITYFWDTVGYVGLLPLVACTLLTARAVALRRRPEGPWLFLAVIGVGALLLALPAWHALMQMIPGTFLRSPARQVYLTTFSLAMALAAAVDLALGWARSRRETWPAAALAVVLALHLWDLGYRHDRPFVIGTAIPRDTGGEEQAFAAKVGQQRIAIDHRLMKPYTRRIDDVGFFDAVVLARPYRALIEVGGAVPDLNLEVVDGSEVSARALRFFGANAMISLTSRKDLPRIRLGRLIRLGRFEIYDVPDPLPRASLVPLDRTRYAGAAEIHAELARPDFDPAGALLLPAGTAAPEAGTARNAAPSVEYRRPSSDRIDVSLVASGPSYLRLLETWDPGWRATLDGRRVELIPAYDVFMAVPIPAGVHEVRLIFSTPGVRTGLALSAISLVLLATLCWTAARPRPSASPS